jgi:hypothetical protein
MDGKNSLTMNFNNEKSFKVDLAYYLEDQSVAYHNIKGKDKVE